MRRLPVNGQCGDKQEQGEWTMPKVLYCSDEDFRTLVMLSEKLLRHAGLMVLMLNHEEKKEPVQHRNTKATGLLDMLPAEFTTAEAVIVGKELGMSERGVRLRLTNGVAENILRRTTKGKYRKNP